jgi:hypothetical protein
MRIAFLLLLAALPASGLTLVYTEPSDGETMRHIIVILPSADGLAIDVSTEKAGRIVASQALLTDPALSALRWRFVDEAAGTDVTAVRDGATISLSGRHRGGSVRRTFAAGADPWYQLFPLGLEPLALNPREPVRFWAIGTMGIAALRIGLFRAVAVGAEEIRWNGAIVPAVRVRIALAGITSILWHGDYWFRADDGKHLVSSSDRGPGTPRLRIELTEER